MSLQIRALDHDDPEQIAGALEALGWTKPVETYELEGNRSRRDHQALGPTGSGVQSSRSSA